MRSRGALAEWLGSGLQSRLQRFDSARRLLSLRVRRPFASGGGGRETCENSPVAPYTWTVREGSLDGPVVMREYVYDVPDKEPVEGQELYLSNGSGPWRVTLREQVPEVPLSPYNILVVESVY